NRFEASGEYTERIFQTGNFLFQKFWYVPWLKYNFTILPGYKKGISGSALGGYNIGINKNINTSRKKAAAVVLDFIISVQMQKNLIGKYKFLTAISSLYDDEDVCNNIDCNSLKKIQFIVRPTSNSSDYSDYSKRFRNAAYKYVFDNKNLYEVIDEMEHLTKPYIINLNPKKNIIGFINSILIFICSIIMIYSLKYLFIDKYRSNFEFLPKDFWIIFVLGAFIIMNTFFVDIGKITVTKCKLKIILLNLGFDLNLVPILYKLLINFPIENIEQKFTNITTSINNTSSKSETENDTHDTYIGKSNDTSNSTIQKMIKCHFKTKIELNNSLKRGLGSTSANSFQSSNDL
ncbi:hypothetical protein PIROE2DRAFT_4141, partial [Piromyces sp. E2]